MSSGNLSPVLLPSPSPLATILAVDDSFEFMEMLAEVLTPEGYQVRPVDSGELALAAVAANPPDLILLDIRMRGMDGLEVCRRLKAREETRHIPIILISGYAEVKDWVEGLQLGADDYITKPFRSEELLTRVKTHLALRKAQLALEQQTASLRKTNERLQVEIVRRQRVEDELRQSLDQAERARLTMLSILEDQKQAEEELRESEERFHQLFDNMSDGVAVYQAVEEGRDFVFVDINKPGQVLSCIRKDEAVGRRVTEAFPAVERLGLLDVLRRVWQSGQSEHHPLALYKDGRVEQWVENYVYKLPSGFIVAIYADTTEKHKAEEEKENLQAQLNQAQKMESVGRLAGGVAHDFNNMLGVILGNVEMALDDLDQTGPLYTNLTEILKAAKRSRDITRQLLAFARKQTIAPKVLDLNETVEGMLKMLRRLIGEDIDLAWRHETGLWSVKMDPVQIDQILVNLCVNARDAIADVGKLFIETGNVVLDAAFCAEHAGAVPGEYVLLAVSDDGSGMDKETLANIFEPFFTTKEVGKGTGLGLATVYGIVKQNNGFIDVESEPGKGTSFKIYLPRYAKQALGTREESIAVISAGHGVTVLLVEDEPTLLAMIKKMLEKLGCAVLAANTPDEAIRLAEEHHGVIRLLMTDVVMPGMNGRDLAKRIRRNRPAIKCLFTSGYTADLIAHHGVLDEGVRFIQKPFSKKDLAAKIKALLREGG